MDSAPDRVTVVVKASNQQFDDQTVVCEPSWSVRKLKEHLQEVYPCKPRIDEQKLIYAGQLLTDKLILKDILRTYEGVHPPNHAMHLVYTPKTRQQLVGSANPAKDKNSPALGDGLRHRTTIQGAASSEATSQPVHSTIPRVATGSVAGNCPNSLPSGGNNVPGLNFTQATNEYLVAQQLAMQSWMQQAYIQYMNQYMNLISIGVRPESVYLQNQSNATTANSNLGIPQMPYLPQNIPFANINSANVPSSSIPPNQVAPANPEVENTAPQAVPVPAPAEQPPQPQNELPQPRFPNIVQEDLPENRDWLDMFYSFSRLLVLLTLVYFYSSPLRCLVVLFIGLAIYFYHVGFFRNAVEANNNNRGREENAPQQQAVQQEVENAPQVGNNQNEAGEQQPATEEPVAADVDGATVTTNPVVESQNNGTSVIAFIRTFVVSFFVSLLPETPAL